MDQDLENLFLDRFVLSGPQIEDILRGWQGTRDELQDERNRRQELITEKFKKVREALDAAESEDDE